MLKAEGRVYTLGEDVGMTGKSIIKEEVLKKAIKGTVPLVRAFESMNDPELVIGHADLSVRDGALWADVTILGPYEDIYKDAIEAGMSPKLGFYAVKVVADPIFGEVESMELRSVCLNETCLGGSLENIKKE